MKSFFLLALLALAAIGTTTAQLEDLHSDDKHYCQEGQPMDACRDYLKQRCTASAMPITWPWRWRMGSCQALRQRCCNQLEQLPPTCRCKAIRTTVQEMQGGGGRGHQMQMTMTKVTQMAKTLLTICNMYPRYCNIPTTDGECYC